MPRLTVENCQKITISDFDFKDIEPSRVEINDQIIEFTKTKCNYGGNRYWFICPKCNRRIGVMYRKPLSNIFLCRYCNNLTYQLSKYRRAKEEQTIKIVHRLNRGIKRQSIFY